MWPQALDALAAAEILFLKNPDTDARAAFFFFKKSKKLFKEKYTESSIYKSI